MLCSAIFVSYEACMGRSYSSLKHFIRHLVLDEGDRMIDMGFAPQLHEILHFLPKDRQTSFFTATVSEKVRDLSRKYLQRAVSVTVGSSRPVAKIKQSVLKVESRQKHETTLNELNARQGSVIVFAKTKQRTNQLSQYLSSYGVSVGRIHGGLSQGQRNRAIQGFKKGQIRVLCATDIAEIGRAHV